MTAAGGGQAVKSRAAAGVSVSPFALEPVLLLESMQCGIERTVFNLELAARALLDHFGRLPPAVTGNPFERAAGPVLELSPREDLQRFRAEERAKLEQYRVIDAQSGIVQIPIERAMDLVAAEHSDGTRTSQ